MYPYPVLKRWHISHMTAISKMTFDPPNTEIRNPLQKNIYNLSQMFTFTIHTASNVTSNPEFSNVCIILKYCEFAVMIHVVLVPLIWIGFIFIIYISMWVYNLYIYVMGCTLIYDLKVQFIFVNFSVYSFEYYFMTLFLIILNKI